MTSSVYSRTMKKAAQLIGSREKLAHHLRVPLAELEKWIAGTAVPTTGTFLKAVDVVLVETQAPSGGEPSGGGEPSDPGDPPAPREGAAVRQFC